MVITFEASFPHFWKINPRNIPTKMCIKTFSWNSVLKEKRKIVITYYSSTHTVYQSSYQKPLEWVLWNKILTKMLWWFCFYKLIMIHYTSEVPKLLWYYNLFIIYYGSEHESSSLFKLIITDDKTMEDWQLSFSWLALPVTEP